MSDSERGREIRRRQRMRARRGRVERMVVGWRVREECEIEERNIRRGKILHIKNSLILSYV